MISLAFWATVINYLDRQQRYRPSYRTEVNGGFPMA
jgi:hypothetical protein